LDVPGWVAAAAIAAPVSGQSRSAETDQEGSQQQADRFGSDPPDDGRIQQVQGRLVSRAHRMLFSTGTMSSCQPCTMAVGQATSCGVYSS